MEKPQPELKVSNVDVVVKTPEYFELHLADLQIQEC